ncbi:MAG: sulfatase [Lentisphaerae bacterium]|jgi:arylsulfatase A|nr:sulfatase [Lentisphaerota bacterium]MBT4820616.1 sulfatase [Lentisphaerota bacterium]MBT5606060.1 sulfatase [Lentisphaerota bacterium]MBT7058055.1 sulfatase [Lentisphaerota bacterium]MBT7845957.1 sulfatase [Lentisphaerota bacterium]
MQKPNFIVIFADNLGYGDFGCYGSTQHRTPVIDQMCTEGLKFTSFYSTSGVCTPSRASMMTGCYPRRVNLHVDDKEAAVLRPVARKGLSPQEITPARLLKQEGYATACIGKWHLGDQIPFLPNNHGFDYFYGIPYSEDMIPSDAEARKGWPPLPLLRNEDVIEAPVNRNYLTKSYTEECVRFITENKDRPFYIYLPHAMPGSTSRPFASPDFQHQSANGPYGDCVEEMDWSTGEILTTLKKLGLDENTLVIWTSDNGAVRRNPPQGSNAPLKGYGYDTTEGAQRMPCIMRWPGRIAPGTVTDELTSTMDILPTLARLAGTCEPQDRIIDGNDIRPIMFAEGDTSSAYDEAGFFYYHVHQLQAVRSGPWKLYLPLQKRLRNLRGDGERTGAQLYDVRNDIAETQEVSADNPAVVQRLMALAENARKDLGDLDLEGANQRPAGWIDAPTPRVM